MAKARLSEEFPLLEETENADPISEPEIETVPEVDAPEEDEGPGLIAEYWARLRSVGLAEQVQRVGTHALSIGMVALVIWAMRVFSPLAVGEAAPAESASAAAAEQATAIPTESAIELPVFTGEPILAGGGIARQAELHTTIPTRPRVDVITYTVQTGDSLFKIAEQFSLQPETILWGNNEVLADNPHLLQPDQVLNILPTNGTYHLWSEGESFEKVAEFYKVEPEAIVNYPGNRLDPFTFNLQNPQIQPGQWLIIPEGRRALKDWGPPAISRTNPAVARYYGPGSCGAIYEGAVGVGTFVWPTTGRQISGYTYNSSIHPAIDIGGSIGNAIYATDSGVIVYAGWSNYGYGFLIVIDHGNGWQSAYAHLSALNVACGQSVFQGSVIGGLGSTGNSSGPHLHFELSFNGGKVNPVNFLQ